jgi:hypothetical protein
MRFSTASCREIHPLLGEYFDGELDGPLASRVEDHVQACAACRDELAELQRLAQALALNEQARVPDNVWPALAARLPAGEPAPGAGRPQAPVSNRRAPGAAGARLRWAVAAAVVLAAGLAGLGLVSQQRRAEARDVNFDALLESLSLDVDAAFSRFLKSNEARASSLSQAREYARGLNFDIPAELPGGFRLQQVFTLGGGLGPGVAARYDRNGEFLAAIFHAPVKREQFGSHRDYDCVVGKHRGHAIRVGEWKLVHLADATTCHCVLSRLDEERDLPAIMAAVAPAAGQHPPRP